MFTKIDCHIHFWELARGDYAWMTEDMKPIQRDFMPADFDSLAKANNISEVVLVQAAPTVAETRYILKLARDCEMVAGIIGKVDIETGGRAREELDEFSADPLFRGIRPMIENMARNRWLELPKLDEIVKRLVELDLNFECMVLPPELDKLGIWLQKHPDLRAILSHAGMPAIARAEFDDWADGIERIAADTGVYCKLSGLTTLAGEGWNIETLRPYVEHLLSCFGHERIIWGSDWPVMLCSGSYTRWCHICDELLHGLDEHMKQAIYSNNAREFYRLNEK